MPKLFKKLAIFSALITLNGCIRIDGPYKGVVVDAETNLPIEGAVVDGEWRKRYLGGGSEYYDNCEVLTDKNGEFKMGHGLIIHSIFYFVQGMDVTIFKAGYSEIRPFGWQSLKQINEIGPSGELMKVYPNDKRQDILNKYHIAWQGNKAIFRLFRMTLEERRQRVIDFPIDLPNKKRRLFELESNKENIEIGSDSNTLFPME
jgi:hypothetical protein